MRTYLNRLMTPFAWAPDIMNSAVHVNDVGAGIALAAEKGRNSETYLLAGDPMSLREVFETGLTQVPCEPWVSAVVAGDTRLRDHA